MFDGIGGAFIKLFDGIRGALNGAAREFANWSGFSVDDSYIFVFTLMPIMFVIISVLIWMMFAVAYIAAATLYECLAKRFARRRRRR